MHIIAVLVIGGYKGERGAVFLMTENNNVELLKHNGTAYTLAKPPHKICSSFLMQPPGTGKSTMAHKRYGHEFNKNICRLPNSESNYKKTFPKTICERQVCRNLLRKNDEDIIIIDTAGEISDLCDIFTRGWL